MYGLSSELTELFGHNDVLVVVDDWRGADSADAAAPIFFMGRSFYRRDHDRLNDLATELHRADAAGWHASRGRAKLFRSRAYRQIVDALESCRSDQYAINHDLLAFDAAHLKPHWDAVRAGRSVRCGRATNHTRRPYSSSWIVSAITSMPSSKAGCRCASSWIASTGVLLRRSVRSRRLVAAKTDGWKRSRSFGKTTRHWLRCFSCSGWLIQRCGHGAGCKPESFRRGGRFASGCSSGEIAGDRQVG